MYRGQVTKSKIFIVEATVSYFREVAEEHLTCRRLDRVTPTGKYCTSRQWEILSKVDSPDRQESDPSASSRRLPAIKGAINHAAVPASAPTQTDTYSLLSRYLLVPQWSHYLLSSLLSPSPSMSPFGFVRSSRVSHSHRCSHYQRCSIQSCEDSAIDK
jgi:hypothetical protein